MKLRILDHVLVYLLLNGEWTDENLLFLCRVSLFFLRFWVFDFLSRLQGAPNVWVHQHAEGVL